MCGKVIKILRKQLKKPYQYNNENCENPCGANYHTMKILWHLQKVALAIYIQYNIYIITESIIDEVLHAWAIISPPASIIGVPHQMTIDHVNALL